MMSQRKSEHEELPYNELVTGFQSRLYAFISTLMRGDAQAADVLQETNVVLWEKASSYDPQSSFAAWAYRIAHFQVMAHRKRHSRDHRLVFSDDLVSTLVSDFQKRTDDLDDRLAALQVCLDRLTDSNRALIRHRYAQGKSVSDMADAMGRKANAVAAALYRIRKTLLDCMEQTVNKEGAVR